ncbi:OmpA family protein [Arcobacter sp. KX21116]|jgi:OOP family OmpA-OmpF porin|uniref:OmpA family protein n=1 Tax=Arcobacter iocasae TaxID=2906515 RepID=UPI0035D47A80|tara:strand:- start:373 stop:1401 length:1029 start_codon:yes stop_codon:yes gene_type:complete
MKKLLLTSLICSSVLFAANSEYKYEVTPMISGAITEGNLDLDRNYANAGVSLGFNLDDSMFDQIELGILRTLGDVDYKNSNQDTAVTRFFTNVVKEYKLNEKSSLYALAGLGVEIYGNEQFSNETGPFANYGFGYKYKLDNDMAIKTDVRHLVSFDNGNNNVIYTVGLAIPFGKKAAPAPVVKEEPKPVMEEPKKVEEPKVLDSDNDGVIDSLDQCPDTMRGANVDKTGCIVMLDLEVHFPINSSIIDETAKHRVKEFAEFLNKHPELKATIEGHTDYTGTEKYNLWLSKRRADSAFEALKKYDVDPARLKTVGYGETRPKATNKTKEGRAQNRRIEATISK